MWERALNERPWVPVVFAGDCDEDGLCPVCEIDYAECTCPGPTMDEMEYRVIDGVLFAREREQ